jgi:rubrerythrin
MEATLTGEDVLSMALDMERTGRIFFEALAGGTENSQAASLFGKLAKAEAVHYAKFKQISDALRAGQASVHCTAAQANELHQLISENIQPSPQEVRNVAMGGNMADAVAMARRMESDAIDFYTSMLDVVDSDSAEMVRHIIKSEHSHLKDLVALAW